MRALSRRRLFALTAAAPVAAVVGPAVAADAGARLRFYRAGMLSANELRGFMHLSTLTVRGTWRVRQGADAEAWEMFANPGAAAERVGWNGLVHTSAEGGDLNIDATHGQALGGADQGVAGLRHVDALHVSQDDHGARTCPAKRQTEKPYPGEHQ